MGCDYCLGIKSLDKQENFYISKDTITDKESLYGKYFKNRLKVQINYCPMCGKDLREEKK